MTLLPQFAVRRLWSLLLVGAAAVPAQDWTGEQLAAQSEGFQTETVPATLEQIGKLLAERAHAFTAMVQRIHGDHREYQLKIDRLLDELADPNWQVRENAERTLVEIGGRAWTTIQAKKDDYQVLEQHIRCGRILDALAAKGTEAEDRERRLLRGLVRTAAYLDPDPRLLRALRSALGHTDSSIAAGAIRALGKLGGDDEVDPVVQMVTFKNGLHRGIALAALARMRAPKALARCRELLLGKGTGPLAEVVLNRTETMAIVRGLRARADDGTRQLLQDVAKQHRDTVMALGAGIALPATGDAVTATLMLSTNRTQVQGTLDAMLGDAMIVSGAFAAPAPATVELPFGDSDTFDFPAHALAAQGATRVFLSQGSLVSGKVVAIDPEGIKLESPLFGTLTLARGEIQGMAFDPELDRLVGASVEHDRLRLRSNAFLDGKIAQLDRGQVTIELTAGGLKQVPIADVSGILFTRPRATEPDPTSYTRLDLVTGERLIGFIADLSPSHVAITVPLVGAVALPWTQVRHAELGVGGGARWGFTLIADYSDNKVIEVDDQGRVVFELNDIFGAWDAECLDNGNLLITEFSVSRVQEVDRKGKTVWSFEDLKNPYDADRLPNGNTLIADTFASRVIEVDPAGKIVWSYAQDIRPFDCDRLPNGNTLIADVLKDRVIEVSPAGEIVWEIKGLPNCHDADRLPNGNTLVTLRNKGCVLEVDRDGKTVWELTGLSSPSDADRLPNGNTIVAENTRVREFDRHGNEVWKKDMTWAVEVNRY